MVEGFYFCSKLLVGVFLARFAAPLVKLRPPQAFTKGEAESSRDDRACCQEDEGSKGVPLLRLEDQLLILGCVVHGQVRQVDAVRAEHQGGQLGSHPHEASDDRRLHWERGLNGKVQAGRYQAYCACSADHHRQPELPCVRPKVLDEEKSKPEGHRKTGEQRSQR